MRVITMPQRGVLPTGIKIKITVDEKTNLQMVEEAWIISDYFSSGFRIQESDIIIDIGAHIGTFTMYAAKLANKGKVYSFEPCLENFLLLERNCKLNDVKNVTLSQYGIYGKKGTAKLFLDEKSECHNIYRKSKEVVSIECITLKDIFDTNKIQLCNFLKIDCEGAEYDVLFNTPADYFERIEKIALEYHDFFCDGKRWCQLVTFLGKKGFKVNIKPFSFDRGILHAENIRNRNLLITKLGNYFKVYVVLIKLGRPFKAVDRTIGRVGIFLNRHFPRLYIKLKKIKEMKNKG